MVVLSYTRPRLTLTMPELLLLPRSGTQVQVQSTSLEEVVQVLGE